MKADHRKQLEKNELASHLDRLWKGAGDVKSNSTIWVIVGVVALVAVLIFAWQYYSGASTKNRASQWRQIEQATDTKDLEAIIENNKGTLLATAAKAQIARIELNNGLNNLGNESQRETAIANIEKARELYAQVHAEAKDEKQLQREAMLAEAKAEESLVGIPKGDNPSEMRGNLDKALQTYEETASTFPDTPQGKEAAARAKEIKENKQKILQFYVDLGKRFAKTELPKLEAPDFKPGSNGPLPPLVIPEPPAKTDTPPKTTTPLLAPPKTDAPKADSAKPAPPKTEAPKTDSAKPAPPKNDAAKPMPPKNDTPKSPAK